MELAQRGVEFRGPSGALGLLGCGALAAAAEMKEEQQDGKKG
jgi:hypothetical protein